MTDRRGRPAQAGRPFSPCAGPHVFWARRSDTAHSPHTMGRPCAAIPVPATRGLWWTGPMASGIRASAPTFRPESTAVEGWHPPSRLDSLERIGRAGEGVGHEQMEDSDSPSCHRVCSASCGRHRLLGNPRRLPAELLSGTSRRFNPNTREARCSSACCRDPGWVGGLVLVG